MKLSFKLLLFFGIFAGLFAGIVIDRKFLSGAEKSMASTELDAIVEHDHDHQAYVCPMHPEIVSNEASSCPICGMDLVPVKQDINEQGEGLPVVAVSALIQNALGVKTVAVVRKDIVRRVETPGFVQQIRPGEKSVFIVPFDATVSALLFKKNAWYEADSPLVELDAEEILSATQHHLQLYEQGTLEPGAGAETAELAGNEAGLVVAESLIVQVDEENDEAAVEIISAQQRAHLQNMGLPEEAIVEMEREMLAEMLRDTGGDTETEAPDIADEDSDSVDESDALKDIDTAVEIDQPVKPETKDVGDDTAAIVTLDDSRRRLYQLGFRPEAILQLEKEKISTSKVTLYSKHPGRIMDLRVEEGDEVEAGGFLFRLGGQIRVMVLANAFQRDATWITTGQKAEIHMPHVSGEIWPGVVNQGAVSINPNSQNIGIKLSFTAPLEKVKMNQYVVGTIFDAMSTDVLVVPLDAVIRTENQERVVLALGDGRFQPVLVTTGVEAGGEVEIKKGLDEEDSVVVMAQFLIDSESSLKASFRRLGEQ